MLRSILLYSYFLLIISYGETIPSPSDSLKNSTNSVPTLTSTSTTITVSEDKHHDKVASKFETSHKIKEKSIEFETAHQVQGRRPIIKDSLFTHKKSFQSKEKPELNPVLSELIGADIKQNIEQKRAAENYYDKTTDVTTVNSVLTTSKSGLIDRVVNLDVAGSENKQTSRIQTKKGPNGQDYEYEYVYYYYDDDEEKMSTFDEKSKGSKKSTADVGEKNRYTTIDRQSSGGDKVNDVGLQKEKGRSAAVSSTEDIDNDRLPLNTRFPPRSKNVSPTQAPDDIIISASQQPQKKISVKRPSLELVDSDSFNTNEKLQKGSAAARLLDSEFKNENNLKLALENEATTNLPMSSEIDTEMPGMDKVALDLYAILANANFDSTTMLDNENDGEVTVTTLEPDSEMTTTAEEESGTDAETIQLSTTTTTTTTTIEPTTTTTTSATTTPVTTTTTEAVLVQTGRSGLNANRNRFRFRSQNLPTTSSTESAATANDNDSKQVSKSRFNRPSFGNRNLNNKFSTTAQPAKEIVEENIEKEDAKSVQSAKPDIKSRNRFNLRGSVRTTTARSAGDDTSSNELPASAPSRVTRPRPTFNIRSRGRPGQHTTGPNTASTTTTETSTGSSSENYGGEKDKVESTKSTNLIGGRSRINIAKPNRFLARGRTPALNMNTKNVNKVENTVVNDADGKEIEKNDEEKNDGNSNGENDEQKVAAETTTVSGLNRLKNRPRIQINKPSERPKQGSAVVANRKPNPLLGRRRIGGLASSSTTIQPLEEDEKSDKIESGERDLLDDAENDKESKETVNPEHHTEPTVTEATRGLGLLANRRKLQRRPGTFNRR